MHKFNYVTKTFFIIAFIAISLNLSAQKKAISKVEVKKTSEVINPTAQSITYTLPQTIIIMETSYSQMFWLGAVFGTFVTGIAALAFMQFS